MSDSTGCASNPSRQGLQDWYKGFDPLRPKGGGQGGSDSCNFVDFPFEEACGSFVVFLRKWAKESKGSPCPCIALGLCGAWGGGKTSFLNFVLDEIGKESEHNSGAEACKESSDRARKSRDLHIVKFDSWMATGGSELINQLMDKLEASMSWGLRRSFNRFRRALCGVNVGVALKWPFAGADISLSGRSEKDAEAGDVLAKRKQVLNKKMGAGGRWIVVVDNLDRLPEARIQLVFQLIGSVLDLQNTLFLLCFDRKVVTKALDGISCGEGERYLDKVCPVCVELPQVDTRQLVAGLFKLDEQSELAKGYWHLFETPRYARQVKAMCFANRAIGAPCKALDTGGVCDMNAEVLTPFEVLGTFIHDRWPGIYAYLAADSQRVTEIVRCVAEYSPMEREAASKTSAPSRGFGVVSDAKPDSADKNSAKLSSEGMVNTEILSAGDDRAAAYREGIQREEDPLGPFRRLLDWAEGDKSLEGRFVPSADLENVLSGRRSLDVGAGLAGFDTARRDTLNLWHVFELLLCRSASGCEGADDEAAKIRGPRLGDVVAGDLLRPVAGPYQDASPFAECAGSQL